MFRLKKSVPVFLLFTMAVVFAAAVNELNLAALMNADIPLRKGETVVTADDPSYLNPPENYLAGKDWRDNFPGTGSYFLRSPGYGLLYLGLRLVFTPAATLVGLKIFQVLLFGLSVVVLYKLSLHLGLNRKIAFATALFVGVCPMFYGFLYYTLTEGVTPALVVLFLYAAVSGVAKKSNFWLILSSLVLGILILIRPPMLVLLLVFPILLLQNFKWKQGPLLAGLWILSLLPFSLWLWRNYQIEGEFTGLYPVYHVENNSLFRPAHQALWNFEKSFGQSGSDFHGFTTSLWAAALNYSPGESLIRTHVQLLPQNVLQHFGYDRLHNAYIQYFHILENQVPFYKKDQAMPRTLPREEESVVREFSGFAAEYRQTYPIHSLLVVPLKVYWNMGAHSNLSLYMLQQTYRGRAWMEVLRLVCFGIHLLVFLVFPIAAIVFYRRPAVLAIVIPGLVYLLYLAFVQRGVEERYTLPFLAPMLLVVVYLGSQIFARIRRSGIRYKIPR